MRLANLANDTREGELAAGLSPCQALCAEDCITVIEHKACPKSCEVCLYWERWLRNDCQWQPTPEDKQYKHAITRELPRNL